MAESLELQQANRSMKRLKLVTFGEGKVSFLNVPITELTKAVEMVKRAGTRKYTIKTDGSGAIEIEYETDDRFSIALYNNSRWVTNIHVEMSSVKIGNVAHAQAMQVSTMHITKNETRQVHATFKIENRGLNMLKRLDVKGENTTWFSVFSHNANLLMARPNGNWVEEKLSYLFDQLNTQAINNYRRSEGQAVLPANDTMVMRRRQEAAELAERQRETQKEGERLTQEETELAERKRKLQEEKEKVKQEVVELAQLKRKLRTVRECCDQEEGEIRLMETRSTRVKTEYAHYRTERAKVVNEIKTVTQAKATLAEHQRELQEAKNIKKKIYMYFRTIVVELKFSRY